MRSGINYVGVKVEEKKEDKGLLVVKDYNPEKHVSVVGEVVCLPMRLDCEAKDFDWFTECEVEIGDIVWIDYHEALMALGRRADIYQEHPDERVFVGGDEGLVMFVRYDMLYYAKRGNQVIMLNDYVMVEPIPEKKEESSGGIILLDKKDKSTVDRAKVLAVGSSVEYKNEKYSSPGAEVGDVILFKKHSMRVSGNDLYEGNHIIQGRFIIGRIV